MGALIEHFDQTGIRFCYRREAARQVIRRARVQLEVLQTECLRTENRLHFITELISQLMIFHAWRDERHALLKVQDTERFTLNPGWTATNTRNLRRACRIALMEAVEPEHAGRILERIQRRGSYDFEGSFDPIRSVITELKTMAAEGEALSIR